MTRTFRARVVGMSFTPDYPTSLYRLEAAALTHFRDLPHHRDDIEPMPALLVREPDNPHDPNAIAVHQPSVGMIGHLPAALAAKLASRMDHPANEVRYEAGIEQVVVHPDHPERPGIELVITETPTNVR